MELALRILALVLFVLATAAGAVRARARGQGPLSQDGHFLWLERWSLILMGLGYIAHCAGLYFIGLEIGRCPLTNLAQVFGFLGWSVVLFYLVIGPTYRLSLFGAFTAPLAAVLLALSLLLPDQRGPRPDIINPWVEFHAATGILAYGAFCLAAITGWLILLQDRALKSCKPARLFFQLPPINALSDVNVRLLLFGLTLLTAGIVGGFVSGVRGSDALKIGWAIAIWLIYSAILALSFSRHLAPKSLGAASVAAVLFTVSSLLGFHLVHLA